MTRAAQCSGASPRVCSYHMTNCDQILPINIRRERETCFWGLATPLNEPQHSQCLPPPQVAEWLGSVIRLWVQIPAAMLSSATPASFYTNMYLSHEAQWYQPVGGDSVRLQASHWPRICCRTEFVCSKSNLMGVGRGRKHLGMLGPMYSPLGWERS